ncbi:hypothetical protein PGTUg99_011621 [Puccinia graminis f. sp. tritici]|uniref:Uncharacterized protein n=1 Tax=Puccinia graminis f. sp. tritici TaxID=56615 RepID=A0A5B0RLG8_PUCGR|nr:hypothetical protein PGTUg99_011621 [Puccinia graminis f. sp. tritici]
MIVKLTVVRLARSSLLTGGPPIIVYRLQITSGALGLTSSAQEYPIAHHPALQTGSTAALYLRSSHTNRS